MARPYRDPLTKPLQRLRGVAGPPRPTPGAWAIEAACRGYAPDDWMDDGPGLPTGAARATCAGCPVRAICLAHALAYDEPWGMWGGLTTRERVARRLRYAA